MWSWQEETEPLRFGLDLFWNLFTDERVATTEGPKAQAAFIELFKQHNSHCLVRTVPAVSLAGAVIVFEMRVACVVAVTTPVPLW
jgi:hypothetical protein